MDFNNTIKKYKDIINKELGNLLDSNRSDVEDKSLRLNYSLIRDFVMSSGKRLRPIVLIMAYRAVNGDNEKSVYLPSLSVELIHNSTLIHDDIMDEDELRRNKSTVFAKSKTWFMENLTDRRYEGKLFREISSRFGVSNAILNGNILLSLGFKALEGKNKALAVLNESYKEVIHGQIMDIMTEFDREITEEGYLEMIKKKTADLFICSIKIGAILGNASDEQIRYLEDYALNSALAFQIQDDIMDISDDMDKGHELGSDIKQGKKNILIIKALEMGKGKLREVLGNEKATLEDLSKAVEEIRSCGALDYAKRLAKKRISIAKESLSKASLNLEGFEFFNDLADYMLERKA